jgi:very-short-patch-repair endonuclease
MRFDSQVELDFWKGYRRMRPWELRGMLPQHDTGKYRIDFAIHRRKFGIEIDGLRYHDGQDAFMRDRRRQRDLEMDGWRITRFAAKEIMNDVDACIREAAEQARELVIA